MSFVSVILTVLGVGLTIASIVIFSRSQRRSRLAVAISDPWSPVEIHGEVKDDVKIYYKNELVTNIFVTQVRIKNSGNLPLRKSDVLEPLTLRFPEETRVIDYNIVAAEPEALSLRLVTTENRNELSCLFDLLNEGERATLRIVCFGNASSPVPHARIAGAKLEILSFENLSEMTLRAKRSIRDILWGSVFTIAGVLAALWAAGVFDGNDPDMIVAAILFSAFLLLAGGSNLRKGIHEQSLKRLL